MSALSAQRMTIEPAAARPVVACSHCTLPVPSGLIEDNEPLQFCCSGCRTAYSVIHSCGLEAYYKLRDATESGGVSQASTRGGTFAEFDDETFQKLYVTERASATGKKVLEAQLYLPSVHCAACVWLVEKLPSVSPGVVESRLDFRRAVVNVAWEPERTSLSRVARALDSLGYTPHPAKDGSAQKMRHAEDRRFLIRIAVAGAIAGNVMLMAFALYAGAFDGMEGIFRGFFRYLSAAFGVVSLGWPGRQFFRGAIASIRTRSPHLDLPIALGLFVGGIAGTVNTIRGEGEIYFDSLTVLVFALLVGRWIQHRQQRWSADAVELMFSLTPTAAHRVNPGGVVQDVPVQSLARGDLVEVRAGESVPADGIVSEGESEIDESLLSGESRPAPVRPGATVCAGAVNASAPIRMRVEASGEETRVAKLMRMVAEAGSRRARIVRLADRFAVRFVVGMLSLSALTLVVWLIRDPAHAAEYATALLIVTCPCALGLATPLAMTVAIGRCARRGMLIKGADALERLSKSGMIFLDKTGTLTQGGMAVVSWMGDDELKGAVASLEAASSHPIARAIVQAFGTTVAPGTVTGISQTTGGGIAGTVNGRAMVVGSPEFVSGGAMKVSGEIEREIERLRNDGVSPVVVSVDSKVVGVIGVGDALRADSKSAVDRLRECGWKPVILSGDDVRVVRSVASKLGIDATDAHGRVSPEEKARMVREAVGRGPVVMVGDGVNDAAALASASVGIAVHGGAEASLSAADIYLSRPGVAPILDLVTAARRTIRTIHIGFGASIFYNALAATLAVTGYINPILAAVLMPVSSVTVLSLAYRSRTFKAMGTEARS